MVEETSLPDQLLLPLQLALGLVHYGLVLRHPSLPSRSVGLEMSQDTTAAVGSRPRLFEAVGEEPLPLQG